VGLNKYSHDAGCCILDKSGKVLFAQAKERFSRVKHDGGAVGDVVAEALVSIGAEPDDVDIVVSNNHHFRIQPFERQLEWQEVSSVRNGACC
jgi:predicted NodU family carbamoyl transferase